MVEVIDHLDNNLKAKIVDGGIGKEYVEIELTRAYFRYSVDVTIKIYGYLMQAVIIQ